MCFLYHIFPSPPHSPSAKHPPPSTLIFLPQTENHRLQPMAFILNQSLCCFHISAVFNDFFQNIGNKKQTSTDFDVVYNISFRDIVIGKRIYAVRQLFNIYFCSAGQFKVVQRKFPLSNTTIIPLSPPIFKSHFLSAHPSSVII